MHAKLKRKWKRNVVIIFSSTPFHPRFGVRLLFLIEYVSIKDFHIVEIWLQCSDYKNPLNYPNFQFVCNHNPKSSSNPWNWWLSKSSNPQAPMQSLKLYTLNSFLLYPELGSPWTWEDYKEHTIPLDVEWNHYSLWTLDSQSSSLNETNIQCLYHSSNLWLKDHKNCYKMCLIWRTCGKRSLETQERYLQLIQYFWGLWW